MFFVCCVGYIYFFFSHLISTVIYLDIIALYGLGWLKSLEVRGNAFNILLSMSANTLQVDFLNFYTFLYVLKLDAIVYLPW